MFLSELTDESSSTVLSVVIPAHDEGDRIERCVRSIQKELKGLAAYEIIVVDNLSSDDTAERALRVGARVLSSRATTVAGVRNHGVAASSGNTLLFLDADCFLGSGWREGFLQARKLLNENRLSFLGSHPSPPHGERVFLWHYWFEPYVARQATSHLGSAHLLCTRSTFDLLNGFNEALATGEDYDFCTRLVAHGGRIVPLAALVAFHDGYPRTYMDFFRRELWHGVGDLSGVGAFLKSRVAVAGVLFSFTVATALVCGFLQLWAVALTIMGISGLVLLVSAAVRFRGSPLGVSTVASICVLPVYLFARGCSILVKAGRWR